MVGRLRAAGCVFAEDEAAVLLTAATSTAELHAMVARRVAGLPLEQVVGWAEFCGLRIVVEPGVFVPRRRSEFLVAQAVARTRVDAVVVDLCCGSGAVGAAVAAAVGRVELHAVDVDAAAVRCARRNLRGTGAQVHQGDLYEPLPAAVRGRVDVLVAVVPYVPTAAIRLMPPEARDHEPWAALDGGADGLDVLRRMAAGAPGWLAPGGHLLAETSERQAGPAAEALARSGLRASVSAFDDLGATVVVGSVSAAGPSCGA